MSSPAPAAAVAREHTSRPPTPPTETSLESTVSTAPLRPSTPPSSGTGDMDDVQATPTQSESSVADYLTSPGHDPLHAIVVPDVTPRRGHSTRRSATPTPRGKDSVIPAVATPAHSRSVGVPATPTSPGHDLAHAIFISGSAPTSPSAQQDSESDDDDVLIVQAPRQSLGQVASQVTSAPEVPAVPQAKWLSCVEHRQVPDQPLVVNRAFTSAKWYLVIRGTFVGVFPFSYWADNATKRVKNSAAVSRHCLQSEAVDEFNQALAAGLVEIV